MASSTLPSALIIQQGASQQKQTTQSQQQQPEEQQQHSKTAGEEGEWLRHANGLLLLNPAWVEVQHILSDYIQDFVRDICEKKPSVAQVMYDVVGHRLMELAMGESFPYQPHLLKEPYMSKEVRQLMRKELQQALTEYLGRRIKKESFFSLPAMTGFQKMMLSIYRARVRVADETNISEQAGQALVYLLKHQRPTSIVPVTSGPDGGGEGGGTSGGEAASAPTSPELGEPEALEEEDEAEEDLWDVVEAEILPPSVRRYLWTRRLADPRKEKAWLQDLQRFTLLNAKTPYRVSPIASLITSGVVQLLADVQPIMELPPSMASSLERLLDTHYSITGRYTRRYINLLIPLLLVFPRGPNPSVEEDARLFTMLSLLYAQTDPQVLGLRATAVLHRRDPALESHLDRLFFSQSLEGNGPTQGEDTRHNKAASPSEHVEPATSALLTLATSVTSLFRYWIEQAFVGILRPAALLLVWDNCLLIGWEDQVPEFCVDLLCLMRDALLQCTTARQAVLLVGEETRYILTDEVSRELKKREDLLDEEDEDDSGEEDNTRGAGDAEHRESRNSL